MHHDSALHEYAPPAWTGRHLVPRPRLTSRLDSALSARITALVAPAGYGKSTLLAQWLRTPQGRQRRAAVITVRERDDTLPRFAQHLIGALARFGTEPQHLRALESTLRDEVRDPAQEIPESFVRGLHDALDEVPRRSVLILEDTHLLRRDNVLLLLDLLAEMLPPPIHLMLTSRTTTPLRRAHALRVQGRLDELTTRELAFTPEEARSYLTQAVDSLTEQQADLLATRCEGWIAGLHLAGRALAAHRDPAAFLRDFTGHSRDIAGFLLHEVLRHQPDEVRDFLLDISVLDVLSPGACQAVTARRDSGALLHTLEEQGGFLSALDDGEHYRLHPLFGEFLRGELTRTDPGRASGRQMLAARWFAHQGRFPAAFDHAVSARDFDLAGTLLARIVTEDTIHRLDPELGAFYARLPRYVVEQHPVLAARMACLALWADQPAEALQWCERTEHLPDSDVGAAEAACMRVFAYWMLGDPQQTIASGVRAQALLERREPAHRHHDTYPRLAMMEALAEAYECTGRYDAALDVIRDGLNRAREGVHPLVSVSFPGKRAALLSHLGRLDQVHEDAELSLATADQLGLSGQPPTVEAHVALAELAWERDDLAASEESFRTADQLCAVADRVWMRARSKIGLARCLASRHRGSEALLVLRDAMGIDPRGSLPAFVRVRIVEQQVRVRLAGGDWTGARGWLSELRRHDVDDDLSTELQAWLDLEHAARPRAALDAVSDLLGSDSARTTPTTRTMIRLHTLATRAAHACGEPDTSRRHAIEAVALAAPEMMVRTLVEAAGPDHTVRMLRQAARGSAHPRSEPFAEAALRAVETDCAQRAGGRTPHAPAAEALIDPLTPTEFELLPFLAMDLTYAEIAANRFVSLNTVKTQMQSIYRKLGVTSRIAAIERSRALGLRTARPDGYRETR